jgi:hypothetical protein
MIGFVTTPETAAEVLDAIREAQTSRGSAHYWTTGSMPIHNGQHAGLTLVPASDEILDTPLRKGQTPRDFPEFDILVDSLGGLEARVDVDEENLVDPNIPQID